MIDIHHHIVYGLDDGPKDIETTKLMLKAAADQGVHTIVATPHIAPGIEHFPMTLYYQRLQEVQSVCESMGLDLRILAGAEIRHTHQTAAYLAEGSIPTLAGSKKILIEFTGKTRFSEIEEAVQTVLRNGAVPILAHIERYPHFIANLRRVEAFKEEYDVYYQVNTETILKNRLHRTIRRLLQQKMIDYVATDTHDLDKRRCNMKAAYDKLAVTVGPDYADRLTGRGMTAEEYLGSVSEQAMDGVVRVYRQKSQMRDDKRNMR
jgi:protein-tyrosine phosphatase